MKKLFKPLFYAGVVMLLTEGCFSSPFKSRTTTVFGTVTDNDTKLPVNSLEIVIYGEKGVLGYVSRDLKTVYTDSNGKYNVVVDAPKEFHSLGVGNLWDRKFNSKYRDFFSYKDSNRVNYCCPVEIGTKTQYDFIMLPK